jgi:hypothetical protein
MGRHDIVVKHMRSLGFDFHAYLRLSLHLRVLSHRSSRLRLCGSGLLKRIDTFVTRIDAVLACRLFFTALRNQAS